MPEAMARKGQGPTMRKLSMWSIWVGVIRRGYTVAFHLVWVT